MSSEQISAKPLPPEKKRCPYCGEVLSSTAEMCWLCREKFSVQEGAAPHYAGNATNEQNAPASRDNMAWVVFGGLALLLCAALAFGAPGILILLFILATPALIRAVVVSTGTNQAAPASGMTFVGTFLGSLGVVVLVGLASFVAFFATFCVVCLGGLSLVDLDLRGDASRLGLVLIASVALTAASVIAGLVPGVAVAVGLFRYFWRKKG